jgi:hypothetical protein
MMPRRMHVDFMVLSRRRGRAARYHEKAIVRPADAVPRSALVHGLCEEARKKSGIQPVTDFPQQRSRAHAKN